MNQRRCERMNQLNQRRFEWMNQLISGEMKKIFNPIVPIYFVKAITLLLIIITPNFLHANITLPGLFSDNMMFQRNHEIEVWGWASNMENVTIDFDHKKYTTKTDTCGLWKIKIEGKPAGGPYELILTGHNSIKLSNILIGDIWVCSGQSNMAMSVSESNHSQREIAAANFPELRLFSVYETMATTPQDNLEGEGWHECNSESVSQFSAAAYFFGRQLNREINVPIGLISSNWGGSVVETWISSEGLVGDETFGAIADGVQYLDLDKEMSAKNSANLSWIEEFRAKDQGIENGEYIWAMNGSNYCDWNSMSIPANWEKKLGNVDGVVWFMKSFVLTSEQANMETFVSLGPVSHSDITWVNGEKIGGINNVYNKPRKYIIKPGVLKQGENKIVVRVENYGWSGGILGAENQVYLQTSAGKMSLSGEWKYKIGALAKKPRVGEKFNMNSLPTLLFNAMIAPITKFPIKGVIWYQGESNEKQAYLYRGLFKRLISDWRQKWGIGDFPFLFVQLPNYMKPVDTPVESEWAVLRESQDLALALPNTGMACAIDIGEMYNIHPKNKQDVGQRLALAALKIAYGKDVIHSGPRLQISEIEGNRVMIEFDQVGEGLQIKDKYGCLKGFTIAGEDKIFKWAKAEIVNKNGVVVYHPDIEKPVAVRYAWADNPNQANLYNSANLPAVPFRTDDWEVITF